MLPVFILVLFSHCINILFIHFPVMNILIVSKFLYCRDEHIYTRCNLVGFTLRYVLGWFLQEIDLEVYLQDAHWGVLFGKTPVRN